MELSFSIDAPARIVRLVYSSEPDFTTWSRVMDRIFEHEGYQPGPTTLGVFSSAEEAEAWLRSPRTNG